MKKYIMMTVFCFFIMACAPQKTRHAISMQEAIAIAREHVRLNEKSTYTASATFSNNEWRVLFESNSSYVGDFVYCHVRSDGKVLRVEGGY